MSGPAENKAYRDELWQERYEQLRRFVLRNGHCRVPARYREDDASLGRWVRLQRAKYPQLPRNKKAALESIPGWFWDGQDAKWERGFRLLAQFVEREGHALVPKLFREDGVQLGVWVMHQRDSYRKGTLSEERGRRLENVPGWTWYPEAGGRKSKSVVHSLKEELTDASSNELAEAVWAALWGLGAVNRNRALRRCAKKMHTDGTIQTERLIRGGRLEEMLSEAIDEALDFEFLDSLKEGSVRAIIREADFYEPADWEMCVKRSLARRTLKRPDAIWAAARWARKNLGLDFIDLQIGSLMWEQIDAAIGRLLKRSELELKRGGMLKTPTPKAAKPEIR